MFLGARSLVRCRCLRSARSTCSSVLRALLGVSTIGTLFVLNFLGRLRRARAARRRRAALGRWGRSPRTTDAGRHRPAGDLFVFLFIQRAHAPVQVHGAGVHPQAIMFSRGSEVVTVLLLRHLRSGARLEDERALVADQEATDQTRGIPNDDERCRSRLSKAEMAELCAPGGRHAGGRAPLGCRGPRFRFVELRALLEPPARRCGYSGPGERAGAGVMREAVEGERSRALRVDSDRGSCRAARWQVESPS